MVDIENATDETTFRLHFVFSRAVLRSAVSKHSITPFHLAM